MLTADQCLAKALEMEGLAQLSADTAMKEDYLRMAEQWRVLASEAELQEAFSLTSLTASR